MILGWTEVHAALYWVKQTRKYTTKGKDVAKKKVILRPRMMCNDLHFTDKGKNLCKAAYKFLHERSERKSEQVLISPGKEHVRLLVTPFPPGLTNRYGFSPYFS